MRYNPSNKSRLFKLVAAGLLKKTLKMLTLGINAQQWTACMLICALLSLSVAAPVGVSMPRAINNDSVNFEPVNEETSVFTSALRNLDAEIEAALTPWRSINWNVSDDSRNDDKTTKLPTSDSKTGGDEDKDNSSADPKKNDAESIEHLPDQPQTEPAISEPASAAIPTAPAAPMLNQLPDSERDSIYSYENNLGSPKGQVEMDSSNQAAALRIRHRAGIANFSFGLPLASLSGRGIDAGASMTYNSRTWNKSCSQYDANNNCTTDHYTYDVEQSWIAPGFTSGFGFLESAAQLRNVIDDPPNNNWHTEITPLGLTDPDGTRRQLYCKSYVVINDSSRCTVYAATDGTFIEFAAKPWIDNPNNSTTPVTSTYDQASWTTVYPNGTKIWYSGGFGSGTSRKHYPLIIQDSNGNRIRIAYKADQSGRIDYITDTLNRQIKFHYENDTSGNPDKLVAVTIPGMGTGEEIQTVRFYYETLTLNSAGKFVGDITAPATIRVLSWVYMPATKTGYKYEYDTNYGMIKKITRYVGVTASTPSLTSTGDIANPTTCLYAASTEYDYPSGTPALTDVPKYTKRTDDWQGRTSTTPQETFYDAPEPSTGADYVSTITVKDNGFDVETKTISAPDGMLKETSVTKKYDIQPPLSSQLMSKTKYTWSTARNLTRIEVTNDAGLTKATEFEYDQYNNQTKVRECGYAAPGTACTDANALRRTETDYETGTGWIAAHLMGLAKSVKTIVGGATVSKTLIDYDNKTSGGAASDANITRRDDIDIATHGSFYNPARPAWTETICPDGQPEGQSALPGQCVIIHHPGYTAASAYRGNVSKVTQFSDATLATDPNADVTEYKHDIAGNLVEATLNCCTVRTYAFHKDHEYAFPTSQTSGTSPTQLTTSATYNRNTGLVLTSKDENLQETSYEYEADTLRPKKTVYPNGGYVQTEYSDKLVTNTADLLPGFVRQTTTLETNKFAQSYGYFNGRGLGIRSASQTTDGWLISAMEYDSLGRVKKSFNPFYGSTPTTAIPTGTKFSEVTAIDALGRTTSVKLQDLTTVSTEFSDVDTTPTGFNKTFVTVTDQASKKRRQIADSLGRIVRVDEPDTNGSLGAVDASLPSQQTSYEYDANDNLSKVTQSDGTVTQERKFKYDSLSRLIAEKQVEADATLDINGVKGPVDPVNKFTKVLKYNNEGQLTDGYDARGVNTHFAYDGLNRVTSVSYSGEVGYQTPTITLTYDEAEGNFYNHGRLTKIQTAANATYGIPATSQNFDYDRVGQVVKHIQSIDNQHYQLEYGYNLAGQLTSEKYPSGRLVTNGFDANGRIASVADASRTYLSGLQYQGIGGALSSMSLGNGTTQTFGLNDRFQMTQQELKRGSEVLQKYNYDYGELDLQGVLKNNGKLESVVSHIGTAKQWTQKFKYDSLGRLSESEEKRGDTNALTYKQRFDFDRFGNMYRKAANNNPSGQQHPLPYTAIEETTTPLTGDIDKATNRFRTGTTYDEAGQVINDTKFRSMGFGYDANGRMVKATKANTPDASTVYDALGNRVATKINDVWTFVIYDAFGKLIADYGGVNSTDEGGVRYVMQDWQGSPRAVVSNTGYVLSRSDFTSFGEEISSGTGLRTASQGFGVSNNARQGYGLTEKDDATGQNHTWFRKNENRAGRWTSPDPYKGSMSLGKPQSFNRFSYVENDPTNFVDPSGLNMVHYVCYDVTTWYSTPDGTRSIVVTTTVCHFFGGGGGGGNPGGVPSGGPGGGTVMPSDPYLEFDGCSLNFIDANGKKTKSWAAVSGLPGRGEPIPTGSYTVDPAKTEAAIWGWTPGGWTPAGYVPSVPIMRPWANTPDEYGSWGDFRTPIVGDAGGRDGFYIHGGKTPGSLGCIDLTAGNNDFHEWFKKQNQALKLNVTNTCNPWK